MCVCVRGVGRGEGLCALLGHLDAKAGVLWGSAEMPLPAPTRPCPLPFLPGDQEEGLRALSLRGPSSQGSICMWEAESSLSGGNVGEET